jgi:hypothetical protein
VEAKGVEGTLMDTVFGDSHMYEACPTVWSRWKSLIHPQLKHSFVSANTAPTANNRRVNLYFQHDNQEQLETVNWRAQHQQRQQQDDPSCHCPIVNNNNNSNQQR